MSLQPRTLPEMTEQKIVTKTVLEFETEDGEGLPVRLRVTLDVHGLTVHDRWDPHVDDFAIDWLELRDLTALEKDLRRWEGEIRFEREETNRVLRELRCVQAIRRTGRSSCVPPDCHRELVCLGPAPRGELQGCEDQLPYSDWPLWDESP